MSDGGHQPALHDLVTVLTAPDAVVSAADGQLRAEGVHGLYRHDRRSLSQLEIEVTGARLVAAGNRSRAGKASFHGAVRPLGDSAHDPTTRYVRERSLDEGKHFRESWTMHNHAVDPVDVTITVTLATDLAGMDAVKSGNPPRMIVPTVVREGARWSSGECDVTATFQRWADEVRTDGPRARWSWRVSVPAGASWDLRLEVVHEESTRSGAFLPQRPRRPVALVAPPPVDDEAERLLRRSLDDLDALLLVGPQDESAQFLAAGSPWFFTLFGRDSLWAARFLLPLSTELAGGTLRALAARQGVRDDPWTEEQPGKIPHEHRRAAIEVATGSGERLHLPPLYYGTVDATALWVCLLHEAWRAGMAESEVEALLPALGAALEWITGPGDPDGDGFCEYRGSSGGGLANQGWKDSHDGVRWADGSLARRPLALCEVQGYAHAAAVGGAELLDAFGGNGDRWRRWAAGLRERFRTSFWITDEFGRYPAIALDGDKRPVSGPASNMAHLLGTGLLDGAESELVARQLEDPAMDSGYGLRTLSAGTVGFNPLSYHCGSVWPHDTAIAVLGLAAEGHHERARQLAAGLLRAAPYFDYRMPELFAGTHFRAGEPPVAYPAACRPQAWSAAGSAAVIGYLQGWKDLPMHAVGRVIP